MSSPYFEVILPIVDAVINPKPNSRLKDPIPPEVLGNILPSAVVYKMQNDTLGILAINVDEYHKTRAGRVRPGITLPPEIAVTLVGHNRTFMLERVWQLAINVQEGHVSTYVLDLDINRAGLIGSVPLGDARSDTLIQNSRGLSTEAAVQLASIAMSTYIYHSSFNDNE